MVLHKALREVPYEVRCVRVVLCEDQAKDEKLGGRESQFIHHDCSQALSQLGFGV